MLPACSDRASPLAPATPPLGHSAFRGHHARPPALRPCHPPPRASLSSRCGHAAAAEATTESQVCRWLGMVCPEQNGEPMAPSMAAPLPGGAARHVPGERLGDGRLRRHGVRGAPRGAAMQTTDHVGSQRPAKQPETAGAEPSITTHREVARAQERSQHRRQARAAPSTPAVAQEYADLVGRGASRIQET